MYPGLVPGQAGAQESPLPALSSQVTPISHSRLTSTKKAVKAALANDFDTPRAVNTILDLVHHANRQLRAVSKVT